MNLYGYLQNDMFPLTEDVALELFDASQTIYLLYSDNTEAVALDRDEIITFLSDGLCGITHSDWEISPMRAARVAAVANAEGRREAGLIYGEGNRFGIYQIPAGTDESRDFRFASMRELEAHGLSVERANYQLVYAAPFSERIEFLSDRNHVLDRIYQEFNGSQPSNYTARAVSVSDVIVLKYGSDISSHFVDSAGFVELTGFLGEESHREAETREAERAGHTFSQVGKSIENAAIAARAERQPPVSKGKPSLFGRLNEAKKEVEKNRQAAAAGIKKERGHDDV
jgi:hypothetical protein